MILSPSHSSSSSSSSFSSSSSSSSSFSEVTADDLFNQMRATQVKLRELQTTQAEYEKKIADISRKLSSLSPSPSSSSSSLTTSTATVTAAQSTTSRKYTSPTFPGNPTYSLIGRELADKEHERARIEYLNRGLEAVDVLTLELDKLKETQPSVALRIKHFMTRIAEFESKRDEVKEKMEVVCNALVEEFEKRADQLLSEFADFNAPHFESLSLLRDNLAEIVEGRFVEIIAPSELNNPTFRRYLYHKRGSFVFPVPSPSQSSQHLGRTSRSSSASNLGPPGSHSPRGTPLSASAITESMHGIMERLMQHHGRSSINASASHSPPGSVPPSPSLSSASPTINGQSFSVKQWRSVSNLSDISDVTVSRSATATPVHLGTTPTLTGSSILLEDRTDEETEAPHPQKITEEEKQVLRKQKAIDSLIPLFPHLTLDNAMQLLVKHGDNLERTMVAIIDQEMDRDARSRASSAIQAVSSIPQVPSSLTASDSSSSGTVMNFAGAIVTPEHKKEWDRFAANMRRIGVEVPPPSLYSAVAAASSVPNASVPTAPLAPPAGPSSPASNVRGENVSSGSLVRNPTALKPQIMNRATSATYTSSSRARGSPSSPSGISALSAQSSPSQSPFPSPSRVSHFPSPNLNTNAQPNRIMPALSNSHTTITSTSNTSLPPFPSSVGSTVPSLSTAVSSGTGGPLTLSYSPHEGTLTKWIATLPRVNVLILKIRDDLDVEFRIITDRNGNPIDDSRASLHIVPASSFFSDLYFRLLPANEVDRLQERRSTMVPVITFQPVVPDSFRLLSIRPAQSRLPLSQYSMEYDPDAQQIVAVEHIEDGPLRFTAYYPHQLLPTTPTVGVSTFFDTVTEIYTQTTDGQHHVLHLHLSDDATNLSASTVQAVPLSPDQSLDRYFAKMQSQLEQYRPFSYMILLQNQKVVAVMFVDEKSVHDDPTNPRASRSQSIAKRRHRSLIRLFFIEHIVPPPGSLVSLEFNDCHTFEPMHNHHTHNHGRHAGVGSAHSHDQESSLCLAIIQQATAPFAASQTPSAPSVQSGKKLLSPQEHKTISTPSVPSSLSRGPNTTDVSPTKGVDSDSDDDQRKRMRGHSISAESEICSRKHPLSLPGLVNVQVVMENGEPVVPARNDVIPACRIRLAKDWEVNALNGSLAAR